MLNADVGVWVLDINGHFGIATPTSVVREAGNCAIQPYTEPRRGN
jgi:hypothetical protein